MNKCRIKLCISKEMSVFDYMCEFGRNSPTGPRKRSNTNTTFMSLSLNSSIDFYFNFIVFGIESQIVIAYLFVRERRQLKKNANDTVK